MRSGVARRAAVIGSGLALVSISLTGCNAPTGPAVPMEAAEYAADPACADVMVRLPMDLNGMAKRSTNAQATAAYGSPAAVLIRCGVPTPEPTTDRCLSVNGIDWIESSLEENIYVFTTYGRTPALEVVVDNTKAPGGVLTGITTPASYLPKTGGCIGPEEVLEDLGATGETAPVETPAATPSN